MSSKIENINETTKISYEKYLENSQNWLRCSEKNTNNLSSILKMMDTIQSELLQAQIDLQDGQHQIRKIESIFQIDYKSTDLNSLINSFQINKNNENENYKETDYQNELFLIKNNRDNSLNTKTQLRNSIVLISNELKKKDKTIQSVKDEMKKIQFEKENLESNITMLSLELNDAKSEYKEKMASFKNKLYSKDIAESKYKIINENLKKQLKEAQSKIWDYEKKNLFHKEKNNKLENQIKYTSQSVTTDIQSYEVKVKTIIEEIKKQNQVIEQENKQLINEFEMIKKELGALQEHCELLSLKIINKEDEIFQLKSKLDNKNQLEEREKLFRREIDENINQLRNYKSQIISLNSDKETYYNKFCEQENIIYKLNNEIILLQNQIKTIKKTTCEQIVYNDSTYSSTFGPPNQSTPSFRSTTEDLNEKSQSCLNYINSNPIENNVVIYEDVNEDLSNNSEFNSTEDKTIRKLVTILRDQTETHCKKDPNHVFLIDDFSKYLEEQLQLIKIANEKHMVSIKHELTIK